MVSASDGLGGGLRWVTARLGGVMMGGVAGLGRGVVKGEILGQVKTGVAARKLALEPLYPRSSNLFFFHVRKTFPLVEIYLDFKVELRE